MDNKQRFEVFFLNLEESMGSLFKRSQKSKQQHEQEDHARKPVGCEKIGR
jgi:hypothetical protein